jgi:ribosome hibernation promoting factor
MRLVLTGRHVDITPGIRRLVDRKLAPLTRHFGDAVVSAQVKLTLEKTRHCADVTVHLRGDHMLNGRGDGATWTAALSGSAQKIQSQATRVKGKWDARRRRRPPIDIPDESVAVPPATAPATPRVMRLSRGQFKLMSVDQAAAQLAAGDAPFVLFRNADNDAPSVLLRQPGQFALFEAGK